MSQRFRSKNILWFTAFFPHCPCHPLSCVLCDAAVSCMCVLEVSPEQHPPSHPAGVQAGAGVSTGLTSGMAADPKPPLGSAELGWRSAIFCWSTSFLLGKCNVHEGDTLISKPSAPCSGMRVGGVTSGIRLKSVRYLGAFDLQELGGPLKSTSEAL